MARGSSKGLHRIKMIQHILDNHIVPIVARKMQEEAGLIQGQARKTALYMKVGDLEKLERELFEPTTEPD